MKVIVKEKEPEVKVQEYPWIGISDETKDIVLFVAYETGVFLLKKDDNSFSPGIYRCDFRENRFKLFIGEIVLSNG